MIMRPVDHAHLIRAYRDVRLPDWPSLEACLLDAIRGGLIRARAVQLAQAAAKPTNRPQRWPFAVRAPAYSGKAAAAGEPEDTST